MKLIFLDIDGVLVCRRPGVFEDALLRNLQSLAQQAGCDIVLSSDWRRHPQARDEARKVLASFGMKVIGCTPRLSPFVAQRPTEIMQWKRDFCKRPGVEAITHWIAIDDRALLEERHGQYLRGHFLHTHPLRGLTEERVEEGIRLLSVEEKQPGEAQEEATSFDPAGGARRGHSTGPERSKGIRPRGSTPSASMAQALAAARAKSATAVTRPLGPPGTGSSGARKAPGSAGGSLLPALPASTGGAGAVPEAGSAMHGRGPAGGGPPEGRRDAGAGAQLQARCDPERVRSSSASRMILKV